MTMHHTARHLFRSRLFVAAFAASSLFGASCEREEPAPPPPPAPEQTHQEDAAADQPDAPEQFDAIARDDDQSFEPSMQTPEHAALSIRYLAVHSTDPQFILPYLSSEQTTLGPDRNGGVQQILGPALLLYAQEERLWRAVSDRFGSVAAERVQAAAMRYQMDIFENGFRDMFRVPRLEEVNRIGALAFVMPTTDDGEPFGGALVFKEAGPDEWRMVVTQRNEPWDERRIANHLSFLAGPLGEAPAYAAALSDIVRRIRSGELETEQEVIDAVEALQSTAG